MTQILQILATKKSRIIAGLMSGTSVDAIDVAIVEVRGFGKDAAIKLLHFSSTDIAPELKARIKKGGDLKASELSLLNVEFGEASVEAVKTALSSGKISNIDLVGSHGQTIYHHGVANKFSTLQIGDGDIISKALLVPVVSDFRSGDIAVGGEGAPLTPYADICLYSSKRNSSQPMVVLNLGGIANLSIFSRTGELTCGFDTGPANAPLDRLARIYSQSKKSYDKDGAIAKRADLDIGLLNKLLASDQYIRRDPPKSTGFEMYGDEWVVNLLKKTKNDAAVAIRIALEFSIEAIKKSLILHCPDFTSATVIVAGGGTQNKFYIERLKQMLSPAKVLISDEVGVPWNAREAMSFALLANDCICGVPTSLPIVTGATRQAILGKISLP